jgi:hypothetical protein
MAKILLKVALNTITLTLIPYRSQNQIQSCSGLFFLSEFLLLITSFGIFKFLTIVLSVLLFTTSDYLLWYLQTFGHCIFCLSIYYFWLPPLVSSNFWPLYCLSFYNDAFFYFISSMPSPIWGKRKGIS